MIKTSKLTLSAVLSGSFLLGGTVLAVAAEAEGGHGGGFPPFNPEHFASQLLWLAITFGALYLLMSRVTLPRIGRILEERHDRIARDLEEASQRRSESEAALAAYEKALTEARNKANSIAGEARNRLNAESEANRKSLEATLATKLEEAERRIDATKVEALSHVRGIAVDTAQTIVTTLVGVTPAAHDVEGAVDTALAIKAAA
ncbi:F0F1 ATP synthase subunit B [Aquabacter sp. CN5-332]|uniref:F0F1 ATP synthase subunit B n=1 Tax=Aquabacter sp. CN5-332 TaxID=3156608 RepID=UPI0032B5927D